MDKIKKAYAISDARISFVSLVNKAANKRKFVITKSEDEPGKANFSSFGRIIKADSESHYVTGVVYEPMTADTDNNYMTEAEITKAAHWFIKNKGNVDLQHNFEKFDGVDVVESWVTKADCEIEGESIKKGTWMMTAEVTDNEVWDKIEKSEITGFSMGGFGNYSETDDDISEVIKSDDSEKFSILKSFASFLGLGSILKGEVKDQYNERIKSSNFWTAFNVLEESLSHWSEFEGKRVMDDKEESIREKLADFNEIITDILTSDNVKKTLEKSAEEIKKSEEVLDMKMEDVQAMVDAAVAKAVKPSTETPVTKTEGQSEVITEETIKKMVTDAVQAATVQKEASTETAPLTMDAVQNIVAKAVQEAMEPVLKSAGIPSNLDNENGGTETVKKSEGHYMDSIFGM